MCVIPYTGGPLAVILACPGEIVIAVQHWKPLLVRLEMYLDNEVEDQRLSWRVWC